ncbi:hypothetical protein [Leptospira sp. GIMC2001]|uniref:hypothetical protein n=1 Tax=Leptospira sp. GIMC2001 TaxID=1513297 RepID=UPI0023499226|nr:hypothetical protein [Leptospira sp. GIMC2001]WCL50725.1 hypothetical protein O4O04_07915 [Leptospira sp. GIMC2001]
MNDIGQNIIALFNSIRIVLADVKKIIDLFDVIFNKNGIKLKWESSSITNGVSSSLYYPDQWVLNGLYRIYEFSSNDIVGFNIAFSKDIEEPIFVGGKIKYQENTQPKEWDLWYIWFDWEPREKVLDGSVINFESKDIVNDQIEKIAIFAIPLKDISNRSEIEKIVLKLINL